MGGQMIKAVILFLSLLLSAVAVQGQAVCSARIEVVVTVLVDGYGEEPDSVRYLVRTQKVADSLLWQPGKLFSDPNADSQWVSISCNDTFKVYLTVWYDTANLLRWSEPGYLASHTSYNFVPSPAAGDFCRPRSLAVGNDASLYCPNLDSLGTMGILVYADSSAPGGLLDSVTSIPDDGTYIPFYVDTVIVHGTDSTYDIEGMVTRLSELNNHARGLPTLIVEVVYPDTTIINYIHSNPFNFARYHFSIPKGDTIILRMYEKSRMPFPTVTAFHIGDFHMNGYCEAVDSVVLTGPKCNCRHLDSLFAHVCRSELPYTWGKHTFDGEGLVTDTIPGHYCDSLIDYHLYVIPVSDTTIYDTVIEDQLPWFFLDSLFYDEVENAPFVLFNEKGCDSTIYYNLFVFWNGDHCDSSLTFPTLVTPNGDGINDQFVIGGLLENDCFKFNDLYIYDRTGQLVYHGHNIASEADWWNPDSQRAPDATYFYIFKAHGVTIHTMRQGVIEVLR